MGKCELWGCGRLAIVPAKFALPGRITTVLDICAYHEIMIASAINLKEQERVRILKEKGLEVI